MKKILAVILSGVLVLGLVIGGIAWKKNSGGKGPVSVYSVADVSTTYWGDANESYGMVTTDRIQNVYLSDTQTVKEVMVKEGQEVKKGDVLMTYDTTLSEVELLKKDLSIQQMELDLQKAKSNLNKINSYRPGVPVSEKNMVTTATDVMQPLKMTLTVGVLNRPMVALLTGEIVNPGDSAEDASTEEETQTTPEETTTEPPTTAAPETEAPETEPPTTAAPETEPAETEEPETEAPETESAETKPSESSETESSTDQPETPPEEIVYPKLIGGRGTDKVPYIFNWSSQWTFDQALLAYLSQGRKDAYVMLKLNAEETEGNDGTSAADEIKPENWWKIEIHRDNLNEYTFEMISMCVEGTVVDVVPSEEPDTPDTPDTPVDPVDPGYDDPVYPGGSGVTYTAAEIAEMLSEAQDRVRDLDLDIRVAKVELEKMQKELDNGAVYAEIDGVVKTVRDEETAKIDSQSLIDVSGGGGYYVTGTVSELALDGISIGTPVTVMSWETYMSYEGTVQSISDYPTNDSYFSGAGNTNVSFYNFTVFIDESAELKEYEYVSLSYTADNQTEGSHFYLMTSMIRSENGKSYVYLANEDNKLERREVRTGKSLWGSYTEIVSGLTMEDQVAFPYGKTVKEGADTSPSTLDELYSYY